ncbi:MAG: CBS domain-containing protein, partial [Methylobacter sp.]
MDSHTIPHCNIDQDTLLIDIATRNVIRLAPEDSVGEAARIMADKRISSIVVTDQHGYPSGIVTERSMLDAMRSECPPDTMLRKIISFPVITVPPSITCLDAYHVFLRDGIRHLVIVSQDLDKLLGVVSETDFRQHINLPTLAGRRQVASVMTRSVFVQPPEASLRDTLNLMHAHRDTCVVVVEDKRPIGIITERDIVRLYSIDPERTNIALSEIMTSPVQTISLKEPINEAAERMLATQLRHL